jgi:hypothetical protein
MSACIFAYLEEVVRTMRPRQCLHVRADHDITNGPLHMVAVMHIRDRMFNDLQKQISNTPAKYQ